MFAVAVVRVNVLDDNADLVLSTQCKGGEKWESAGKIKLCPGVNPGECGVPTHQAQTSSNVSCVARVGVVC